MSAMTTGRSTSRPSSTLYWTSTCSERSMAARTPRSPMPSVRTSTQPSVPVGYGPLNPFPSVDSARGGAEAASSPICPNLKGYVGSALDFVLDGGSGGEDGADALGDELLVKRVGRVVAVAGGVVEVGDDGDVVVAFGDPGIEPE